MTPWVWVLKRSGGRWSLAIPLCPSTRGLATGQVLGAVTWPDWPDFLAKNQAKSYRFAGKKSCRIHPQIIGGQNSPSVVVNILLIMVNIWAIIWLMMVNNPFFRWILPEADGTMRRWPAATSLGETIAINCRFRHQWQLQGHLYFVGAHDCKRLNPLQFASNRFVFLVQVFRSLKGSKGVFQTT